MVSLKINGSGHELDLDPDMPLLWAVRDALDMTGTKYGCGIGQCGACTVHLDGQPVRSCQTPVSAAAGHEITTIEGIHGKVADAVQAAWRDLDVVQCGYCQSGQVMAATALLQATPRPGEAEIQAAMTNICRCGTYNMIAAAIRQAAEAA